MIDGKEEMDKTIGKLLLIPTDAILEPIEITEELIRKNSLFESDYYELKIRIKYGNTSLIRNIQLWELKNEKSLAEKYIEELNDRINNLEAAK